MVDHNLEIVVQIDDKELTDAEERVETLKTEGTKTIEFVKKETRLTFRNIITATHATWVMVNNFLQAFGVSISSQFRAMISMGISSISFLYPLLTAEMATPGMWAQGALGLVNLVMAQVALTAAQMEQTNIANTTFQINQAFHSMHGIIGSLNFLG